MQLSHFTAALLCALFASIVFGVTQKDGTLEQLRYGVKSFFGLMLLVIAGGWLLWILKH